MSAPTPLSIIVPVYNDAASIEQALASLQPLRARGHELLVVDGGSRDGGVTLARRHADRVLLSGTGTVLQMNSGSEYASHDILLFLPLGTALPPDADALIAAALQPAAAQWGGFRLRFASGGLGALAASFVINRLASSRGSVVAEQCVFAKRPFFERVRGFDTTTPQTLCERLRMAAPPVLLPQAVTSLTADVRRLL